MRVSLERALSDSLVRFLTQEVRSYQRRIPNNLDNLKKHIRPGDVLLVEGKTRVAQAIKYVTQSSWSHSTIYVGEQPVRPGGPHRERFRERYGEEAQHLVIEADLADGVSAVPLSKYVEYNIRVCRPYCLTDADRERVVEEVTAHIGDRYDRRQLVDLGRYLTPFHLLPARWRRKAFFSGQSDSRAVICSSLIAQAFLGVRYPILPVLPASVGEEKADGLFPWGTRIRSPHPRLVLPRDFDLSPYFRIVKFNSVEEGPFEYQRLEWLDPVATDREVRGRRSSGKPRGPK
jgi:Permuted papain-like amidase enzyme, YaeF/YiiX, C92 family